MALEAIANLFINQLTGFALWLLLLPFRVVVALLDPIARPFMNPLSQVVEFVSTIETLKGFFTDVNWFIPFAAASAIIRLTFQCAFVLAVMQIVGGATFSTFQDLIVDMVKSQLRAVGDGVSKVLHALARFFFGV